MDATGEDVAALKTLPTLRQILWFLVCCAVFGALCGGAMEAGLGCWQGGFSSVDPGKVASRALGFGVLLPLNFGALFYFAYERRRKATEPERTPAERRRRLLAAIAGHLALPATMCMMLTTPRASPFFPRIPAHLLLLQWALSWSLAWVGSILGRGVARALAIMGLLFMTLYTFTLVYKAFLQ